MSQVLIKCSAARGWADYGEETTVGVRGGVLPRDQSRELPAGFVRGQGAAEAFEGCLGESCGRFGWRVHAFVIMRNHFHLALETTEPNLSVGMKHLQRTSANRFNRSRGENGRPFQGRFKSWHVRPGHALAQVAHYLHLNPVRAKAIGIGKIGEFRWSSLWWFLQRSARRPGWR